MVGTAKDIRRLIHLSSKRANPNYTNLFHAGLKLESVTKTLKSELLKAYRRMIFRDRWQLAKVPGYGKRKGQGKGSKGKGRGILIHSQALGNGSSGSGESGQDKTSTPSQNRDMDTPSSSSDSTVPRLPSNDSVDEAESDPENVASMDEAKLDQRLWEELFADFEF